MRLAYVLAGLMIVAGGIRGAGVARAQEFAGGGRGPAPARPIPPVGWTYRWVPPVYTTVSDRVWVPGTTQLVQDWVETSPGRWEQVWRQVMTPGHWDTTTRRVLVQEGYWQLMRIEPPLPVPPPVILPSPPWGTVGVDGYSSGPGEDLSKFSPLSAWPEKK